MESAPLHTSIPIEPAPYRSPPAAPTLVLFDVDGTLAMPAQEASAETLAMLQELRTRGYLVGICGAGDFEKQQKQLGGPGLLTRLDYCFSENGVHAFRGPRLLHCKSMADEVGPELWREFEARLELLLLSVREEAAQLLQAAVGPDADIGQRSTFLERRQCTVNVCVIGRSPALSREERAAFVAADQRAGLRERLMGELLRQFGPATPFGLTFAISGQIGIDCAPVGWDKTFGLRFLEPRAAFPTIHFFGDKTHEGGGDYELYMSERTFGHAVESPEHTNLEVRRLLL